MELNNNLFHIPGLESHGIFLVLKSHGKLKFCLMTKQGQCEIERSNYTAQTASISVEIRVCIC